MTNEEAKQEAIKKAYGSSYEAFTPDKSGWGRAIGTIDLDRYDVEQNGYLDYYRPKELQGIDDNNGWTRIEPDGSNMPTINGDYKVISSDQDVDCSGSYDLNGLKEYLKKHSITHYKPLKEEPKPIY